MPKRRARSGRMSGLRSPQRMRSTGISDRRGRSSISRYPEFSLDDVSRIRTNIHPELPGFYDPLHLQIVEGELVQVQHKTEFSSVTCLQAHSPERPELFHRTRHARGHLAGIELND